MDAAVEQAAGALGARPDDAEVKAARAKAEQLLADPGMAAGMKDLQNFALAVGLGTARAALRQLIAAGTASEAKKNALFKAADAISPITEPGCQRIDYQDLATGLRRTKYLELDVCDANHDLNAQLDPLKAAIGDEKWPGVLKHLSVLVGIGRSVYTKFAHENPSLMAEIRQWLPEKDKEQDLLTLLVDTTNTTLYVLKHLPRRVGIFAREEQP